MMVSRLLAIILLVALVTSCSGSKHTIASSQQTTPVLPTGSPAQSQPPLAPSYTRVLITAPPTTLSLDTFYKKYTDAWGIPIVSSQKVPDDALLVARDIVNYML